jgi:energy-coupling factor transport system substrate-specific component
VSWQLVSFALVLLSLGFAFWWYERSRPPAKLIAVIATLATLAALGRDAFVAVPDLKPITAIVLVSGIAFGAGPGFAVGAISALASNILLGQGPWTPWQMLAWGLVGLMGAGLGAVTRRRMSPLAIALSCAAAAEAFNLILDLYTWTGAGNHTLAAFGVVLGSALVFDLTHVIASFAFGLAFGAALLRMLLRVRSRLQVTWDPVQAAPDRAPHLGVPAGTLVVLAAVAVTGALAAGSAPAARAAQGLSSQVSYLAAAQGSDGGFGAAPGESSSELYSAWAAIGLAASGRDPLTVRRDGHTVLDAIRAQASTLQGAGDIERTILALHACGVSTRSLGGVNLVSELLSSRSGDGSFSDLGNLTAFGVLALRAAGYPASAPAVRSAVHWLASQQEPDGGFSFAVRGSGSDVDDTAASVQALVAAGGRSGSDVRRAVTFLTHSQNLDGGFPEEAGGASNAQSTAWAVQGLVAAGHDVTGLTHDGSRSPLAYLRSLAEPDGSVRYSRTGSQTPVWVTAQALTALALKPFPVGPVAARADVPRAARSAGVSAAAPRARAHAVRPGARRTERAPVAPSVSAAVAVGAVVGRTVEPLMRGLSGAL